MFNIEPERLNTKTDQLLYDILQELKKINESKDPQPEPISKGDSPKKKKRG